MTNPNITEPNPVRIEEDGQPLHVAGLSEIYSFDAPLNGAAQWKRFASYLGEVSGQKGDVAYGVCFNLENGEGLEYLCGVEVAETVDLPGELTQKYLPAQRYAVFLHEGHVSTLRQTLDEISKWLPSSEFERPEGVNFFFERYDERFDAKSGRGEIEIWIPIK